MQEFNIGDEIIDIYGNIGKITKICKCSDCEKRGFYEPQIESFDSDLFMSLTNYDLENGFEQFYKIGNTLYPNHVDIEYLKNTLEDLQKHADIIQKFIERVGLKY